MKSYFGCRSLLYVLMIKARVEPAAWQVTVGPKCGKDKLMQAVGRMRQLGKGQTLEFISSPEARI